MVAVIVTVISPELVLYPVKVTCALPPASVAAALALRVPPVDTLKVTCKSSSATPSVAA